MGRRPVIGVMGGHIATEDVARQAEALGEAIAKEGWILLNGGRDEGVMRASARGASRAGGFVVGLHPGAFADGDVAPDLDLVVFTGIGFARNMSNVLTSDVIVALPGGYGTLNEVAYARTFGKPLVLYGYDDRGVAGDVPRVDSLEACLEAIRKAL